MKKKFKLGDEGRFLVEDHAMGNGSQGSTIQFYVYGRIVDILPTAYVISAWVATNFEPDQNMEWFGIIKGTILEFRPIARRKSA